MALIRIVRPYQPVDPDLFRDVGPSYGRVTGQNYGGAMAVAGGPVSPRILPATTPARQAQMAAYKASRRAVVGCGRLMRTETPCGRSAGHNGSCASRDSMERKALRRRAGAS